MPSARFMKGGMINLIVGIWGGGGGGGGGEPRAGGPAVSADGDNVKRTSSG